MVADPRPAPARCRVRTARPQDAPFLAHWRGEASVRRFQPLPPVDEATLRRELERQPPGGLRDGLGDRHQWIIEVAGRPAGWVTLAVVNWDHGLAEVGYALSTPYQGLGLMIEALAAVLDEIPARTRIARIEARCASGNRPSRRVLERLGFRHEGTLRGYFVLDGVRQDNELYALLRSDPRP